MKHNWIVTLVLVGLFLLAQIIGLAIIREYVDLNASRAKGSVVWEDLPSLAGYRMERPEAGPGVSVAYIMGALIIGTILILLIVRWQSVLLWKVWFWLAVLFCLHVAFSAFIPSPYAPVLAVVLASMKILRPGVLVHNATELFVYGGLASIFVPLLTPVSVIVLLLLISLYDMYAVWRSEHMVKLAKFQAGTGIFAGILLPYSPKKLMLHGRAGIRKVRTAILGGGDIGFPLLFSGVVLGRSGMLSALLVSLGATLALFGLLYFGEKKKFYPAMPFLTIGCLAGYFLGFVA
jgi:presenilin-like A22 family membrane protease